MNKSNMMMANLSNIMSSLTLAMQIVHTHWYSQCPHQIFYIYTFVLNFSVILFFPIFAL